MANGDVPELGIAITGDSSSVQQAASDAKTAVTDLGAVALDASQKAAMAAENAAAAYYDVVKAAQSAENETQQLSSVEIALTQNIQLQATAYDSVRVALQQRQAEIAKSIQAQDEFNRRLDQEAAVNQAVAASANQAANAVAGMGNAHSSAFGKIVTGSRYASGAMRGFFEVSRGGIFTIGGLARAMNDLFLVVGAAGAAAGPFALLALGIGVVIGALRGMANHLGHAHKGLKDVSDESQRLKAALKEVEAESKKDLKAMEEQVQALVADYRELIGLMGEAEKRIKELDAATQKRDLAKLRLTEVQELAGAKTDEEREAIRTKYGRLKEATQGRFEATATQNEVLQSQVRENNARRVLNALEDQRLALVQDAAKKAQAASEAAAVGIQTARKVLGSPAIDTTTVGLPFGKSVELGVGDPTRTAQIKILGDETIAATALRVAAENAAKALDEFDKKARAGRDEAQKEIDTAQATREKAALETETSGFQNKERAIEAKHDFASQEAGYKGGLESYRKSTEEAQLAIFHATSKEALDAAQMAYSQISDGYAAMAKESRAFTRKFGQQVQQQKNASSYSSGGN